MKAESRLARGTPNAQFRILGQVEPPCEPYRLRVCFSSPQASKVCHWRYPWFAAWPPDLGRNRETQPTFSADSPAPQWPPRRFRRPVPPLRHGLSLPQSTFSQSHGCDVGWRWVPRVIKCLEMTYSPCFMKNLPYVWLWEMPHQSFLY